MSVNSSLSTPPFFDLYLMVSNCLISRAGLIGILTFTISSVLFLLPIYLFTLYLGYRQWRSGAMMGHSDLFTYHMVSSELISILGFILICSSNLAGLYQLAVPATQLSLLNGSVQLFFHILTCVERYLAVIHPVVYLSLRKERGIRIRNVSVGCAWLLSSGASCLVFIDIHAIKIFSLVLTLLAFAVISFCSFSVLCALIRPGPGEAGGSRKQVQQTKLRAFYTIVAILGTLFVRIAGNIVGIALFEIPGMGEMEMCVLFLCLNWFLVPSSLVIPLLFIHRAGKIPSCKNTV